MNYLEAKDKIIQDYFNVVGVDRNKAPKQVKHVLNLLIDEYTLGAKAKKLSKDTSIYEEYPATYNSMVLYLDAISSKTSNLKTLRRLALQELQNYYGILVRSKGKLTLYIFEDSSYMKSVYDTVILSKDISYLVSNSVFNLEVSNEDFVKRTIVGTFGLEKQDLFCYKYKEGIVLVPNNRIRI